MDDILHPFNNSFVLVYLDDILIFNKSWPEHLHHIHQVLHALQKHKLYDNLDKCSFGMKEVQYLSFIVDYHGVHVAPAKIQFIHDWPTPTTLSELHNFLILDNFYRKFVLGFYHIAWPFIQAVTKGVFKSKFVWAKSQ
jgi:hypothetical protein